MAFLGPYYYGKHKWEKYLLDVEQTIESGNAAHRRSIQLQSEALDVAQGQVEELRQQTEQLHRIEDALNSGFEALRAEFEWGFTLIVDRMDRQIQELSHITARLDAIHKTLESPSDSGEGAFSVGRGAAQEGPPGQGTRSIPPSGAKE